MTSFYVRMFVLRVCRGSQNDLTFSNRITTIFDVCFFYCWSTCSILLVCGFAQCHFWQPHVSTEGQDMNQHREHNSDGMLSINALNKPQHRKFRQVLSQLFKQTHQHHTSTLNKKNPTIKQAINTVASTRFCPSSIRPSITRLPHLQSQHQIYTPH